MVIDRELMFWVGVGTFVGASLIGSPYWAGVGAGVFGFIATEWLIKNGYIGI